MFFKSKKHEKIFTAIYDNMIETCLDKPQFVARQLPLKIGGENFPGFIVSWWDVTRETWTTRYFAINEKGENIYDHNF